jgi:hypothetical protein
MQLTDEALAEWRAHPVTEYVRAVLGKSLGFQREQCKAAAWAGTPWPEEKRLSLHRVLTLSEDMFEASAADFVTILNLEME